jgi:predicted NAD/FAD-binding protein
MKIAVIGSGIAGNVAAHYLHREHDITVFEAGDHAGGHSHTHDIALGGRNFAVDTGFIVFNDRTYPNFLRLLGELGVASQESSMSFSVRDESSGLEYNGTTLDALFAQRRNLLRPSFLGMVRDILRFNREAPALLDAADDSLTLGAFLDAGGYRRPFVEHYLVPMGAAIWSTDPRRMLGFPARYFVRFFHNHGMLNVNDRPVWRSLPGGSRSYVQRLTQPFAHRLRLRTPVRGLRRLANQVLVELDGAASERFDCVFLACHSDQALALLRDPAAAEREALGAIGYQENEAVLHTDTRLLPRARRAWAAWNYHVPAEPLPRVALTYNMNILQRLDAPETLCVTLNRREAIDPARIIKRITYHHPLYTPAAVAAQARQRELNGARRTYYCGAYWGFGFHEDGVVSALEALRHFRDDLNNAQLPLRRIA